MLLFAYVLTPYSKQEKRVKVTVRYTAEAGLRPFYLNVANRIKLAHPDILLEKRMATRMVTLSTKSLLFEYLVPERVGHSIGTGSTSRVLIRT
jgi:hypothetical protein